MSGPAAISSAIFRAAGSNGTTATATMSAASGAATRGPSGRWRPDSPARPTSLAATTARRRRVSISSPPMTVSRSPTSSPTTRSTTTRTANAIATAPTENFSWNHGVEGATDDKSIRDARLTDIRALLATLFVSRGTPMLTAGDELGRTQSRQQQRLRAGQSDHLDRLDLGRRRADRVHRRAGRVPQGASRPVRRRFSRRPPEGRNRYRRRDLAAPGRPADGLGRLDCGGPHPRHGTLRRRDCGASRRSRRHLDQRRETNPPASGCRSNVRALRGGGLTQPQARPLTFRTTRRYRSTCPDVRLLYSAKRSVTRLANCRRYLVLEN